MQPDNWLDNTLSASVFYCPAKDTPLSTTERRLREQICLAGRELRQRGLNVGSEGNISCQLDSSQVLITPTSRDKASLGADQIVRISSQGEILAGTEQPSSEWRLHAAAYAASESLNATVHLHSPYATAFAVAERELPLDRFSELVALLDEVPLLPYAPPGSQELADLVAARVEEHHTLLLARHGVVSFGSDLDQAVSRVVAAEHCAQILWLAESLQNERGN